MGTTITPVEGWHEEEFAVRNRHEWMEVHVATKGSAIKLKINSSFKSMAYSWPACGPDVDWREWLLDTEFDYFMGKMFGLEAKEFSLTRSVAACQSHIEESFQFEEMTEDRFGELVDELHDMQESIKFETDDPRFQAEMYYTRLSKFPEFQEFYYEMGYQVPRADLVAFWDTLWRPFIEGVQR